MSVAIIDELSADARPAVVETLADLVERLGDVPLSRIRFRPFPGTATEQDVLEAEAKQRRLCELVDGVLVEKPIGYRESMMAMLLGSLLLEFVEKWKLGAVSGEAGMMRLAPGLVRIPDVSFLSAARRPRDLATQSIARVSPDLAIEVLSPSNTRAEIALKLREYFEHGTRLVWVFDPKPRTCAVYTSPDQCRTLTAEDTLDGGDVLPGLAISLSELFRRLDEQVGT